jgi:hypothetical protein
LGPLESLEQWRAQGGKGEEDSQDYKGEAEQAGPNMCGCPTHMRGHDAVAAEMNDVKVKKKEPRRDGGCWFRNVRALLAIKVLVCVLCMPRVSVVVGDE